MEININNLIFKYGDTQVLEVKSLNIPCASKVLVLGANAAGKTTFFRLLTKNLELNDKSIKISNKALQEYTHLELAKKIAYLPQDLDVPVNFQVKDLFEFSARLNGSKYHNDYPISDLDERKLTELSSGQKKSAFLYSCLFQAKDLLILDEPYANLDITHAKVAQKRIFQECTARKLTLLLSHHSNLINLSNFTHVLGLKSGTIEFFLNVNEFKPKDAGLLYDCQASEIDINSENFIALL